MIQSLRQRHRIIILILALLVPIIYIVGLLVRKPIPSNQHLPAPAKGATR